MKYLLVILMLFVASYSKAESDLDRAEALSASILKLMPEYSCFRISYKVKAEQPWEIDHIYRSQAYMLVKKSDTAVLIAQPSAHDEDIKDESKIHYWLRTVDLDDRDNWIVDLTVSECPKHLTKKFIQNYIKKNYHGEIKL